MRDIKTYTAKWLSAYFESDDWQQQAIDITRDLLTFMVLTLTEKVYDEYRKTQTASDYREMQSIISGIVDILYSINVLTKK